MHPLCQLLPEPGGVEKVYVYSVGLKVDRSHLFKLTTAVDRVLESLDELTRPAFVDILGRYLGIGLELSQRAQYELEPGFIVTLAPSLFRVDDRSDILRPESFVGETVPQRVVDIRYQVSLESLSALSQVEREQLLSQLLRGKM